jgi:glycosyltransferase involved in cell wall biosynthesis
MAAPALPRILHIRASNFLGSPERLILGQVRLGKTFHHIPISYIKKGLPSEFNTALASQKLEHYLISEAFAGDFSPVLAIARLVRRLRPKLVVTHDYKSNLWTRISGTFVDCRHAIYFHGHTAECSRVLFYNAIDRRVMKQVHSIVTVADSLKAYLTKFGVPSDRIQVVSNAVPDSAFEAVEPLVLPTIAEKPFIGAVGRLSYEKGFDLLIKAFADQKPSEPLVIFGDGPERQRLQSQVADLGLTGKVHFAGHIPDLRPAYAAMKFLVIPSRSEGFPLALLEAWAQGTPVVSTPVGALKNVVRDGYNGLLALDVSADSISAALSAACRIPDFKQRCGANGKDTAASQYRFCSQVPVWEALYCEIAGTN